MVDLSEFGNGRRSAVRSELGIDESEVLIGWVGRLDPKKNVEDFIDAAASLQGSCPTAKFVAVSVQPRSVSAQG
jgi:glycosyltransferase involved in cell wall biosynthesis